MEEEQQHPRQILAPDGPVARRLEHYEERPQQQDMVAHVEQCLTAGRHLMIEAGTGVGKSFGYLVPAMHHAYRTGERILVSTRTIALQDQLDLKDLPLLGAVLPFEVPAMVAKGRNNYLCLRRLDRAILHAPNLFDQEGAKSQLKELKSWSETTREGTRSDLAYQPDASVWEQVMAESGNCNQRRCPHYDRCFYQSARRRMESSRIVVVNHALYFSDLALRIAGAAYLPDHTVAVFDEAHMVDAIATKQLGTELGPGRLEHLLSRLSSQRTGKGLLKSVGETHALEAVRETRAAAREFFKEVGAWQKRLDADGQGRLIGDEPFVANSLSAPLAILSGALLQAAEREGLQEDDRMELAQYGMRAGALGRAATVLLDERPAEYVIWVEGKAKRLKIVGAPLKVGEMLAQHLYPAKRSCVFTSATLTTGSDKGFDYMRSRLGVPECDQAKLGSPFPFARNVEIHLRSDMPDPGAGKAYDESVLSEIRRAVLEEGGRALVLFTNWRMVERARELTGTLSDRGIATIFQGEGPVQRLVERKRRCEESVLFGVESLWEGIDIPGDALTLVIIPKLPFPVPTNPLVQARSREMEKEGRRPFWEYHLPEAILRLKQGFGRLVRSAEDKGRVLFLDRRLLTKPYGKRFIRALPACPVVVHTGEGESSRIEVEG